MARFAHILFIAVLSSIVVATFIILTYMGMSYYSTSMEERFFHPLHESLKPSGIVGHGLGIVGSLLMILGMLLYMARKRFRALSRLGALKYWLEFHIFLCTLGPIMVLFHTSFKFGGLVSVSLWSMVAVFLSGVIGRFIYIQIPRTIEGRELSLNEVRSMKSNIGEVLKGSHNLNDESFRKILALVDVKRPYDQTRTIAYIVKRHVADIRTFRIVKSELRKNPISRVDYKRIVLLVKKDLTLNRKIERLVTMQKLFNYWHVAHMPFALVMLIIMVVHVAVTLVFGYKWIF